LFIIRPLIWIGSLFVLAAGVVAGVRAVGQTAPLTPTYLQTGACEQPCWQGMRPGLDYIDHVMDQVGRGSPYSARTTDYGDGIAQSFELSTYGALTLADVIHEFGTPERVGCLGTDHSSLYPGQQWVMSAQLYFARGLVVVDVVRPDSYPRLTPDMRVRAVQYFAPGDPLYPIGQTTGWHGFASTHVHYLDCHP
jgi:hypothetical protein